MRITKTKVKSKAGAFADDVWALCSKNIGSAQGVFSEYERLTRKSGLTLNASKTEIIVIYSIILRLNSCHAAAGKVL